jgi:hypothetical protein
MLDPDIVVTRIAEDRRLGAGEKIVSHIRVEYKVGDHGPFVEHFPKEVYTMEVRDAKLNAFAREVRAR